MRHALIVLGLCAAPLLPLAFSHAAGLERVRDWWLRGVTLASILVAPVFLAPLAAWYAWRWPGGPDETAQGHPEPWRWVEPIGVWVGLGITWALIVQLEPTWWPTVAAGWVAWGVIQVALLAYRASRHGWRGFGRRQTGTMGTSVMTALYLALTAPFWPVWLWPVLALGLWLTCSWAAFLALGAGAAVYLVPWRG